MSLMDHSSFHHRHLQMQTVCNTMPKICLNASCITAEVAVGNSTKVQRYPHTRSDWQAQSLQQCSLGVSAFAGGLVELELESIV